MNGDWRLEIVVKEKQEKTKHSFEGAIRNGDWRLEGAVDVYGFTDVSCIYQIMCNIDIQINI